MCNTFVTFPLHTVCQLLMSANMSCGTSFIDVRMPEQTELPKGYTKFPDIGMAYKYYNQSRNWNSAKNACAAYGANLAVIDSFKKIEYVLEMFKPAENLWTGIHRFFDTAEWVSLKTALSLAAIPWAPGEPSSEKLDQHCAGLYKDGTGLFSEMCDKVADFICEIELVAWPFPDSDK